MTKLSTDRRRLLLGMGAAASGAALAAGCPFHAAQAATGDAAHVADAPSPNPSAAERQPFYGVHQAGIVTPRPANGMVSAFNVVLRKPADMEKLFRALTDRIVFLTNLMMVPLAAVMAAFVWRTPPLETLPYLLALGVVAILGHMALVRGLARIDASLVMTLEFSRLPFAVLLGYVVFGELIDQWTWLGALVIFASGLYITRREAKLRRQRLEHERI